MPRQVFANDIERVAASLAGLGLTAVRTATGVRSYDPGTEVTVTVEIAGRIKQEDTPAPPYNTPGHIARPDIRAPGVLRENRVKPRKLGHVVLGSTDQAGSQRLFTEGLGFKISDTVPGLAAFMRCSTDHHNVLVQQAPLAFLHHTSWQVNDIDEVGCGPTMMLEKDPARHVWGLGRHHVGSNFFWYLRDPAGQLLRVLLRPGLHRRRRAVDPADLGRRARPLQLGTASPAVVPGTRGPGRLDDRRARRELMTSVDCDVLVIGYGPVGCDRR